MKRLISLLLFSAFPALVISATTHPAATNSTMNSSLAYDALAKELGWVKSNQYQCGGYYLEPSFALPVSDSQKSTLAITGNQGVFSLRGVSTLEGKVSITRRGQQITSQKGILYRDPNTGKLSSVDLVGDVHLREPNTLIVANKGNYNFQTSHKTLYDILYRTVINGREVVGSANVPQASTLNDRKITATTAWGGADEFSQDEPKVFELTGASYSTCAPTNPAWRVKASHLVLNKETGRGYATNARILVKGVPVFYTPYINFPLDKRRKSGFLWPTVGINGSFGPYVLAPFYWNMAPNYDMTITPAVLTKRGFQLSDNYRYLTPLNEGNVRFAVLPQDTAFADQKTAYKEKYSSSTDPTVQADLNRLLNSSPTRRSLLWRDRGQYNEHWSSHVDFNYAGDDYYTKDFGSDLNEVTQNQLLQEGDINYKGPNWNFIGRVQAYQTLHMVQIGQPPNQNLQNQYRRFPQLVLNGDYPDQAHGLEYFINNEATHFTILNTPGTLANQPIGNRLHTQPGVSLPLMWPYMYVTPRAQIALTHYDLYQTTPTQTPDIHRRAIPIIDVLIGSSLVRETSIFNHGFQQTLEPQVYYTYIPYRNQASIPIFDTTVNTLSYDQIFNYNRFSSIDRIGDANQVGLGVSSRFLDSTSGLEKVRVGAGEIVYFANRKVTLCNGTACPDNPTNPSNHWRLSPLSGVLDYHINKSWSFSTNVIWNPISKQLDNSSTSLHYEPDDSRIINLGYNFVRSGDVLSGITAINNSQNNLKNTDLSFAWPVLRDFSAVGRWAYAWNTHHLQNLLYGIQYDTCCWAVRFVGGRVFTSLDPDNKNTLNYNTLGYLEFSLKGLGDIGGGNANPNSMLGSINGYKTHFGQDF